MEELQKAYQYDQQGNVIYEGFAPAGTPKNAKFWKVKKYVRDSAGRTLEELWANGDPNYVISWEERVLPEINYDKKRRFK